MNSNDLINQAVPRLFINIGLIKMIIIKRLNVIFLRDDNYFDVSDFLC